jgi:hypothetical protein
MYATDEFKLGKFTTSEDVFNREIIEIDDFILRYKQYSDFTEIIPRARELLK